MKIANYQARQHKSWFRGLKEMTRRRWASLPFIVFQGLPILTLGTTLAGVPPPFHVLADGLSAFNHDPSPPPWRLLEACEYGILSSR